MLLEDRDIKTILPERYSNRSIYKGYSQEISA